MADAVFHIVIPARYASSRFPGKPLCVIAGKPMIEHVYQRALETTATSITVATDDQRIVDHCDQAGIPVVMTAVEHASGTDRIGEVADIKEWASDQIIVGLQGDEPATPPGIINQVAQNLSANPEASMATLCAPITRREEYLDTNRVKVVFDKQGYALYFSRAPIPHRRDDTGQRDTDFPQSWVHIGIYAYRRSFLREYQSIPEHELEREEKLEQLRALAAGHRIHVSTAVDTPAHGVDTPADVAIVEPLLEPP